MHCACDRQVTCVAQENADSVESVDLPMIDSQEKVLYLRLFSFLNETRTLLRNAFLANPFESNAIKYQHRIHLTAKSDVIRLARKNGNGLMY